MLQPRPVNARLPHHRSKRSFVRIWLQCRLVFFKLDHEVSQRQLTRKSHAANGVDVGDIIFGGLQRLEVSQYALQTLELDDH